MLDPIPPTTHPSARGRRRRAAQGPMNLDEVLRAVPGRRGSSVVLNLLAEPLAKRVLRRLVMRTEIMPLRAAS